MNWMRQLHECYNIVFNPIPKVDNKQILFLIYNIKDVQIFINDKKQYFF